MIFFPCSRVRVIPEHENAYLIYKFEKVTESQFIAMEWHFAPNRLDSTATVATDIKDVHAHQWNQRSIREPLGETWEQELNSPGFALTMGQDRYVWKFNFCRQFSVKEAYKLLSNQTQPSNSISSYNIQWKALWKLCHDCIPLRSRLSQRHIIAHSHCLLCGDEEGNLDHL